VPGNNARGAEALLGFADAIEVRAAAETASAPGPELHLLTFTLDREEFGIPVTQVREVIRVAQITRVPQAPAHVRGVANLRGRILAVVELRSRMGLAPAEITPRARIVVVEVRGRVLGLLVAGFPLGTTTPPPGGGPPPDEVLSGESDYVTGVARWQSRLIILLDLETALAPTE
jgi:purine-binding chemotaxis protein CheW